MTTNRTRLIKLASLMVMALATSAPAVAVPVPIAARLGDNPVDPGTGLNGEFWDHNAPLNSIADALVVIGSRAADATFHSTSPDYPPGTAIGSIDSDANTLNTFLGATDSATLSGFGDSTLDESVFRFTGFINITEAMDRFPGGDINISFASQNDDGTRLTIGGAVIIETGNQAFSQPNPGLAEFEAAGIYEFEFLFYENGGNTGFHLLSNVPGGAAAGGPNGVVGVLPTSMLYTALPAGDGGGGGAIPEPASVSLLALGALALIRRRRAA